MSFINHITMDDEQPIGTELIGLCGFVFKKTKDREDTIGVCVECVNLALEIISDLDRRMDELFRATAHLESLHHLDHIPLEMMAKLAHAFWSPGAGHPEGPYMEDGAFYGRAAV